MCIESYTCGFYGKPVSARESIHLGTSQVSEYYEGNNGRKMPPKMMTLFISIFFLNGLILFVKSYNWQSQLIDVKYQTYRRLFN